MDVLKSARRAFIRSPSLTKQSRSSGKHQKLPENWTDTRETLLEGMTFNLRHLGMTLVDQPKGEELSAAAVKRIVATAKASGKKLPKVILKVSPQGIVLCDSVSNQLIENISIYRISYCTADKMHDKVFAFIAQNQQNETLECHAFFCAKRKVAQAVTLTVAQAFRVAFEFWEVAKEERENCVKWDSAGETSNSSQSERSVSLKGGAIATDNLLDIDDYSSAVENVDNPPEPNNNSTTLWEMDDGLEEAFSSCSLDSYEYSPGNKYRSSPVPIQPKLNFHPLHTQICVPFIYCLSVCYIIPLPCCLPEPCQLSLINPTKLASWAGTDPTHRSDCEFDGRVLQ
ncbi:low density lipoprotein receptor adapter protein 1-A-like isoform X1 [Sinocyclocheilus rhinocerous]|uniref:low density lipoprotein receptor adapter protein 1-A-like isoform X1 n=1 Tax=Sinocyclocheilus rhinocerous TaxID=307959 RepID=UPI0007B9A59B|nr:PREDICTED: low density lipoprotein receptor adapter protein 1-A-like isoform X1 [Sinocyclocheilus rhinocerous]